MVFLLYKHWRILNELYSNFFLTNYVVKCFRSKDRITINCFIKWFADENVKNFISNGDPCWKFSSLQTTYTGSAGFEPTQNHRTAQYANCNLPSEVFYKKGVLRNFAKLPVACNFIKKETLAQEFLCEFCEISKNTFFTEHFRKTTSTDSRFVDSFYLLVVISGLFEISKAIIILVKKLKVSLPGLS